MKILWSNHRDWENPRAGGAERTIKEVSTRLVNMGNEVHLLTTGQRESEDAVTLGGVQIHRFRGSVLPHVALIKLERTLEPDVVVDDLAHVVPWGSPWIGDAPGVAFFRHLHKRTLSGQVSPLAARLLSTVERFYPVIYRKFSFIVESKQSRSDLEALGVPRHRIHAIRPGVDLDGYRPGQLSGQIQLVFFAGLRPYKRPEHAIRVVQSLHETGLECGLIVVGGGPQESALRGLSRNLGVEKHVRFAGRLSDTDLQAIVASSWVNLNCSIAEGWGYSVLEAAAAGVPTVAYDVPGLREALGDGACGVVVQDGDVNALARGVAHIIEDRPGWTDRCRDFAEGFSWDRCASEWQSTLGLASA